MTGETTNEQLTTVTTFSSTPGPLPSPTNMTHKSIIFIYITVFLDSVAAGLVVPLLPYFAQELGANVSTIGLLGSIYGFAQLIGSPIMGRMGDRYGRVPLLLLSLAASGTSYVMLGGARTMTMFVLSRLPVGFLKQTGTLSEGLIADMGDRSQRSELLGYLGLGMGAGLIIGPPLGGLLSSKIGLHYPAYLAGVVYVVSILIVWIFVPQTHIKKLTPDDSSTKTFNQAGFKPNLDDTDVAEAEDEQIEALIDSIRHKEYQKVVDSDKNLGIGARIIQVLRKGEIWVLCVSRLGSVLATAVFMKSLPLITAEKFSFSAQENGLLMGYLGLVHAIVQGLVIRPLTRRYCDCSLLTWSMVGLSISLVMVAFAQTWQIMLVVLIPMGLSSGVLNTVLTSSLSKRVLPENLGGMLGISGSVTSFSRALAPWLGALLLEHVSDYAPAVFGAAVCGLLSVTVRCSISIEGQPAIPKKID